MLENSTYNPEVTLPIRDNNACQPIGTVTANTNAKNVYIEPLNHGYIVTVGCQKFAIESLTNLIKNIELYLSNPLAVEKAWMGKDFNSLMFPKL